MKYKVKILYKDKVEPTQVIESDNNEEVLSSFNKIMMDSIFNDESSVIGVLVMVDKK